MKNLIYLIVFFFVNSANSEINLSSEVVSEELSICAAYFAVVSKATENSKKPELSEFYMQMSSNVLIFAMEMVKGGRSDEMAQKVVNSRHEMNVKKMLKEIDYEAANVSILLNQHMENCELAVNNPEEFVNKNSKK